MSLRLRPLVAPIGCALLLWCGGTGVANAQQPVTFSRDIAPILFAHCTSCHRDGEIGGFSLVRFAEARPRARAIAQMVRTRRMPPWKPEPIQGATFVGERRLSDRDISLIEQWAADGAPEGDPKTLPEPPGYPQGWRLGEPDLIVRMEAPYELAAGGPDVLRNFVLPVPSTPRRYVSAIEFRPGNARVVHHANIRVDRTRTSRTLDAADPAPGYEGVFSASAVFPDGHFLGWTPGQLPPALAPGLAWTLEPQSDLVVQLHLHPTDRSERVQVAVGLFFTDHPPSRTPVMLRLGRQNVDIPAGISEYTVEDAYVLPVDVDVHAVQPHAHYRAREINGVAIRPDGTTQPLIHIVDWDFNWQDLYRFQTPLALPAGTTLRMRYRFDNSSANRRNPDRPPRRVSWGQNSTDEMSDLWIQVVTRTTTDRAALMADFGPKVMLEDAVGYETLIQRDPRNARLHEAVASIYSWLGRHTRALAHLDTAATLNPLSAETHYNRGTTLAVERRLADARAAFEAALRIDPNYAEAHTNLGAVLRRLNDPDTAAMHLERGLAINPASVAGHTNLAGLQAERGRLSEALPHYREAVRLDPTSLEAVTDLAWILATTSDPTIRNPHEALELAFAADQRTNHNHVRVLETLAAAQAAQGAFADAATTQRRAAARARAGGSSPEVLRVLEDRAELYRAGRALIMPAPALR